jgi:anti-sigma B factor antagonist
MPLTLDARFCGDVFVMLCQGRIVLGEESNLLETTLNNRAREFTQLVLNLSEIDRLDSTGMGMIVRFAASLRKRGGDLYLAAPPTFVTRMMEITGLSSVVHIYSTEEDAILAFLRRAPAPLGPHKSGPKVLFLDSSRDLCAFVKTVLEQHGYQVKPASLLHDARIILKVDHVDYVLAGPGSPQQSSEDLMASLKAWAPNAITLQLDADFKARDAQEAAKILLQLFPASPQAPQA